MVCDEIEKIERAGNRAKNQTGGNMFGGVSTIISCNITCHMKVYITRTTTLSASSFFLEWSCYQMVYHKTEGSGLRYKHLCMHRAVSGELEAKLKRT